MFIVADLVSLNGQLSLDRQKINQRSDYDLPNSAFWGWLSVESQPQNPEFRNNHLRSIDESPSWHATDCTRHPMIKPGSEVKKTFIMLNSAEHKTQNLSCS